MNQSDLKALYDSILIGDKVDVFPAEGKVLAGVLMDKYLRESNVFADILLDNGFMLEFQPFFVGNTQRIRIVDKV